MKAIVTKYLGPSDARGPRFKAMAEGGSTPLSVTVPYDYALNAEENHAAAARTLAVKYGWTGSYAGGTLPTGDMVWVNRGESKFTVTEATIAAAKKPARRR